MPDILDVMHVTMDDLSPEQRIQLKDAIDQFQQKCLMPFGKNRSGVPYLKSDMPRFFYQGNMIPRLLRRNRKLWRLFGKLWKA
jgi:hypothetical protein